MTAGEVKLGLIGLGTVGTGMVQLLQRNHTSMTEKLGRPLRLVRVASRSLDTKPRPDLGHARLSTDPWTVVSDPEVEV
ncbi:MAG: homoserine dehydrogenase, partial [Candidatus Binatia bacterium]